MVQLTRFRRHPLGHFPTPLERMERLEAHLRKQLPTVPRLWIKRDDCTGLATGGNKTRKLEFLVGDAVTRGADTLITTGAVQSNHARQTAAAAAATGMTCKLILERRQARDDDYEHSGNVLLAEILGAEIIDRLPAGADVVATMNDVAASVEKRGGTPYVVPSGGSNPIGALGYVACAQELESAPFPVDWVVHSTGSCGTQAGLVAGFAALHSDTRVLGVTVGREASAQIDAVRTLTARTEALLQTSGTATHEDVRVDGRWTGSGYGVPTDVTISAIHQLARTEGIILDPVYTGKGFAGLLGNIADGTFAEDENVVFLHTGGVAGLFGYRSAFDAEYESARASTSGVTS